jgi:hypothetical protein
MALVLGAGCARPHRASDERTGATLSRDSSMTAPDVADVLRRNTPTLMAIPGVTGTGEGKRGAQAVVVVYVGQATPELKERIPREIEGYPVEVREIGKVTAPPP